MNALDIRATLQQLAADTLGTDTLPEGELADHLDSVERLGLVVAIEDHFQIAFDPEDEEEVRTLDDVIAVVTRKLATR